MGLFIRLTMQFNYLWFRANLIKNHCSSFFLLSRITWSFSSRLGLEFSSLARDFLGRARASRIYKKPQFFVFLPSRYDPYFLFFFFFDASLSSCCVHPLRTTSPQLPHERWKILAADAFSRTRYELREAPIQGTKKIMQNQQPADSFYPLGAKLITCDHSVPFSLIGFFRDIPRAVPIRNLNQQLVDYFLHCSSQFYFFLRCDKKFNK